ncbi:hypothetical protein HMPREF3048_09110 [Corynebacterium sp. HMSC075D04]|uniref:M20 family metallopeptidase n=1 Tax=Corynebacterium TaxID=1716 RepID=UPI0008A3B84E|nr:MULTISPECIES: M20 family metallopeptidase [Corynebacterium]MDK6493175.1 M20 family metallopeptidase [Corynebacterium coyleae]OFO33959.1 hypothetical protein HMPREF3048_09110 [Corynebacterium sp. HMSC075D04]
MSISLEQAKSFQSEVEQQILELVDIESFSTDLEALDRCSKLIENWIPNFVTNATVKRHESDKFGDTLVVKVPGKKPINVLLVSHYDTVWPTGTLDAWEVREYTDEQGERRLSGPGIFDMKTGLVEMLWVAKLLQQSDDCPSITLVINGDEELGSPFSRPIIEQEADNADAAFVFEASADGAVKTARKGIAILRLYATGVESHAGLDPWKGASAIDALVEVCAQIKLLEDREKETTFNVGLIEGGTGSNVVAGRASAIVDVRYWTPDEQPRIEQALKQITWGNERANVQIDIEWNRPPMVRTEGTENLFHLLQQQASALGEELEEIAVGGASDANYISERGIPVICGLGAVGDGAHARHEFIFPDRIPATIATVTNAIEALSRE